MITVCPELRADCQRIGHPLGYKIHDGDRRVAATAIRLRVPIVSHDRVFRVVPHLQLITAASG
jgi:predicted nucleic acid-binding protein